MHGNYTAVTAMQRADLLLALGSRFDDRVTGKVSSFAPVAKVIHVDIDKAEIGKVRRPEVGIVADCRLAIEALIEAAPAIGAGRPQPACAVDRHPATSGRRSIPYTYDRSEPEQTEVDIRSAIRAAADAQAPVRHRAAAGRRRLQTRSWRPGSASIRCGPRSTGASSIPNTWINSGGLGTMGFAVPAAIGAKVGSPRPDGVGGRRRRVLPDDRAGARHRERRADPGEDRHLEQRLSRDGAPVAAHVLRGALLRGLPLARPSRLRGMGRGDGLCGPAGREPGRGHSGDREGERHRRQARW